MSDSSYQLDTLNDKQNETPNILPLPQASSNPVQTRKRGFSLRSQLFDKNIRSQAESSLEAGKTKHDREQLNRGKSFKHLNADIDLKRVENCYNPTDSNEYIELSKRTNFDLNESIIDLNSDSNLTSNFKPENNYFKIFKNIYHALTGARIDLPSSGGREIPICINIEKSGFSTIANKKNEYLLIDKRKEAPYTDNIITSSRYTLISFIPRQLIAQFSKIANCYFMCIAIFQLIPSWSTTGTSTTIIPLSIFISISILREAWDDFRRHKLDKEENNRQTTVIGELENNLNTSIFQSNMINKSVTSFTQLRNSNSFDLNENEEEIEQLCQNENSFENPQLLSSSGIKSENKKWKNIKVGNIIKLECDEWVPADIILLTSTNEMGEAFIETMALDGETNLKAKIPNQNINKIANKAKSLFNINGSVLVEDPNLDLYNFEGSLNLPDFESSNEIKKYPLNIENVIYRGSIIRNTDACLGLVIFTGEESKIRMNAIKNPRIKAPKLQGKINLIVIFMVFVVIILSCFSLMAERLHYNQYKQTAWYVNGNDVGIVPTLMGFIIMYNTLIPLSLYVTMEIIKVVQLVLLQWDIDMYHLPSDTPAEARTATILEELGQVSYIFSDKTGTLTDNIMLFRKFSICGVPWIHDIDLLTDQKFEDPNDFSSVFNPKISKTGTLLTTGRPSMASLKTKDDIKTIIGEDDKALDFNQNLKSSLDFIKYIQLEPNSIFAKKATFFMLSIAICHTCLPRKVKMDNDDNNSSIDIDSIDNSQGEHLNPFSTNNNVDDNDNDSDEIQYQASSPDELALIQAANEMGFILFENKQNIIKLKTYPNGFESEAKITEYKILDIIEFSSARKRMSIIVKFPDDKIVMFCKGADNVIIDKLKNSENVKKIQMKLSMSITERKNAEAQYILSKKSMDVNSINRTSLSSLSEGLKINQKNDLFQIDQIIDGDDHVKEIISDSRKSLDIDQNKRFKNNSYIPSDRLILNEDFVLEKTLKHIEMFSSDGLRTLLYSFKYLEESVYNRWHERYSDAKTALINRSEKIEKIGDEIESGFELLGCTAIEDKLQEGVPEAIEKFRRAGIKLWMLTGDKRETAINIGYSCKLIKDYSTVVILCNEGNQNNLEKLISMMTAAELELDQGNVAHCVIVIDGSTLTFIETDPTCMSLFISLGVKSDSVICCRASPSQKATMVTKIRELDFNKVTLAIGDGANDIAMIQSADVGVGITGKEGLQAARTSDYSIAQFRFLLKLLLVHGRYNYIRTSKFVLCTFYKEFMFYLSQLIYQRYTLFTGSSLYESWSLSMFNTLFTSLPVLCIGMFDKDLKPATLIAIPELYKKGRSNESLNFLIFISWVLLAASQSTILCFTLFNIYGFPATIDNTTYALGVVMFTVFIIIINTKCNFIEMHSLSKLSFISWSISVFGWIIWCMLLVGLYKSKLSKIFYVKNGLFEHFGKDPTFWGSILVLTLIGLWIDFIFHFIRLCFKLTDTDIFQRLETDPEIRKKLELNSFSELKQSWQWEHQSDIISNKINEYSSLKRNIYYFRSFMKKGSINSSEQYKIRKRNGTIVNPHELNNDAPTIVTLNSNDNWTEEMLPSGKVIRTRKNSNAPFNQISNRTIKNIFKREGNNGAYTEEDIDDILKRRADGLDEEV